MRSAVTTAGMLACLLIGGLLTGCGETTVRDASLTGTRAELTRARGEVRSYAKALAAEVEASRISYSPVVLGGYSSCPREKAHVTYGDTITVRAAAPATLSVMSREIARILRSEGWRLVSVDFAKVHLALADTNHPLYYMSQHGIKGAANILPYGKDSAGAVIFMHSPCLRAS
jgi:hypothetical protein